VCGNQNASTPFCRKGKVERNGPCITASREEQPHENDAELVAVHVVVALRLCASLQNNVKSDTSTLCAQRLRLCRALASPPLSRIRAVASLCGRNRPALITTTTTTNKKNISLTFSLVHTRQRKRKEMKKLKWEKPPLLLCSAACLRCCPSTPLVQCGSQRRAVGVSFLGFCGFCGFSLFGCLLLLAHDLCVAELALGHRRRVCHLALPLLGYLFLRLCTIPRSLVATCAYPAFCKCTLFCA